MLLGDKGTVRGNHQKPPQFCLPLAPPALPHAMGSSFRVSGRKKQSNSPGSLGDFGLAGTG